jgi:serine/threonine-protein kinase
MQDISNPRAPGSQFGRFTIESELGTGGMGRVYRAHDPTLNRPVAIKILRDDGAAARDRLLAEARSASALNHPNICTIYEIGDVGGVPFIAMELITGQALSSLIPVGGLSTDIVTRIGLEIAAALAHAHERGVAHGDLKPQNVIVTGSGSVKLLDFGLARTVDPVSLESITRAGTAPVVDEIAGTLPYMAPETLRGVARKPPADVWALGVLLYEMAAGRRPFAGLTAFDLVSGILNATPPPLPASTDLAFIAIVDRCLQKDPALRYRTARDAQLALEPLAAAFGIRRDRTIERPPLHRVTVALAAISAAALLGAYFWLDRTADTTATRSSIASLVVLPFDNLSGDVGEDYFASGMTDALITDLSRLPNLKVISRTSSARYQALAKSSREIGRDLGVEAIVEGSVLRASDQVRISVRLVDADTDRNLWAQDYTREVQDVLLLQADVARAIASEIRASFVPADQQRFASAAAVEPQAVEEYLKGRHQWNRRTPSSLLQAVAHFRRAVALQPDYAAAHAGIAESLVVLPGFPISTMSPEEALPEAIASAERAIALDDRLAEAHAALAYARLHSLDPAGAETSFRRALTVNPGYATAHFWYAAALAAGGRFDDSIVEAKRAETLDPASPIIVSGTAWMYHLARRFEEEVQSARAALALDPNFLMAYYRLGEGLLHLGRASEAVAALEKARLLSDSGPDMIATVAYAYGRVGREREARDSLRRLLKLRESKTRYVSSYALALVQTGLADRDEAFAWLRRARNERAWGMAFANVEADLDPLRLDPRFAAVGK